MLLTLALTLLTLVWHANGSALPAGTVPSETISIASDLSDLVVQPDVVETNKNAPNSDVLTCPNLSPIFQSPSKTTSKSRLIRRGRSSTRFGTEFATVPIQEQTSSSNIITLTYDKDGGSPGSKRDSFVQVAIFDQREKHKHVVPNWQKLDGSTSDQTIQAGLSEINPDVNTNSIRIILKARIVQLLYQASGELARVKTEDPSSPSFLVNRVQQDALTAGGWTLWLGVFDGIPGYSYRIKRPDPMAPLPDRTSVAEISQMAMGVAAILLAKTVLSFVDWELDDKQNPVTNTFAAQDATYVLILLQVLRSLLRSGMNVVSKANAKGAAALRLDDLRSALDLYGGGYVGGQRTPLLSEHGFKAELLPLEICQPPGGPRRVPGGDLSTA